MENAFKELACMECFTCETILETLATTLVIAPVHLKPPFIQGCGVLEKRDK